MEIKTYQRVPNDVQAVQYLATSEGGAEMKQFLMGIEYKHQGVDDDTQLVVTNPRSGDRSTADFGDWVIKNSAGDYYVVPSDVFAETYKIKEVK